MRKTFVGFALFLTSLTGFCQDKSLDEINEWHKSYKTGMYTLAGWSVINIGTGIYGNFQYDGETKYFHQMNALWNTVNLSLSTAGLLRKSKFDSSEKQVGFSKKLEKTLEINTYLDLGYIVTGGLMVGLSSEDNNQIRGYGKSIIIQGVFLFVFDEIFKIALRDKRKELTKKSAFIIHTAPGSLSLTF